MARTGDWVTLYVDGVRYLEKPPLPYWLVALDYRLFGENVLATHLPMTLAVLGNGILAYLWAGRAFGRRAGFYAAAALFTTVGVFLFTRIFIPEALLSLLLALALWAFLTALEDGRPRLLYLSYAALAAATLTKGLIAPLFFLGTALLYLLATGDWRRWRTLRLLSGTLLYLLLAAPWHILAALANPDHGHPSGNVPSFGHVHGFLYFYFVNEHFLRFLGARYPHDYNKQAGWVFWAGHLAWLFPWVLFFPAAAARFWPQRHTFSRSLQRGTPPAGAGASARERFRARTTLLLGLYGSLVLLFFALSTNQEYYTWPAYFPLLVLLAGSLSLQEDSAQARPGRWLLAAHWLLALAGTAVAVALAAGLWAARSLPYNDDVGTLLAHRNVGDYTFAMSRFFDLTGPAMAALRLPAGLAAVTLLLGPLLALLLRRRGRHFEATTSVALTMAMFLVAAHIALVRFGPLLSSRSMAEVVNRTAEPADQLLVYGDQSYASSLLFYTHRQALLVNGRSSSMLWGSFYPDAPRIFLEDGALRPLWDEANAHHRRLYLFVTADFDRHVRQLLGSEELFVAKALSDRTLYTNRPLATPQKSKEAGSL